MFVIYQFSSIEVIFTNKMGSLISIVYSVFLIKKKKLDDVFQFVND